MIKLVVVDDHEAMRDGLVGLLKRHRLDVVAVASTGASAVDAVAQALPDVVLLDVTLPDGDVRTVVSTIRRAGRGAAILLYGDASEAAELTAGLRAGAAGAALKRAPAVELIEAIRRLAAGGRHLDPRLPSAVAVGHGSSHAGLSPREREVLELMALGLTARGVGERLGVSEETVRTHSRNATRKLGSRNRVHAIAVALSRGEIALG